MSLSSAPSGSYADGKFGGKDGKATFTETAWHGLQAPGKEGGKHGRLSRLPLSTEMQGRREAGFAVWKLSSGAQRGQG